MDPQIHSRIHAVRARLRNIVWMYGVCFFVAVAIGLACCIGLLDWWLHLDDAGTRFLLALVAAASIIAVTWRFLISPLRVHLTDVDVALQIERRVDGFQDRLSSLVEFASRDFGDEQGSPELQESIRNDTLERLRHVQLAQVISAKPVKPIATAAFAVTLLLAAFITADGASVAIAAKRMMLPFQSTPWPKKTELQLISSEFQPIASSTEPLRVSHGSEVEFFVVNKKGALPDAVVLHKEYPSGRVEQQELRRTNLRDNEGTNREVAYVGFVAKSKLKFWVVGGDDSSMPHYSVEVVPPPMITRLNVTITPPAYTGESQRENPEGVGHIQAVAHSRVAVSGTVNKSLKSGSITIGATPSKPLHIETDGRSFAAEFVLTSPGNSFYQLTFTDEDGFSSGGEFRYEIRVKEDRVPTVDVLEPEGDVLVTANATVGLRVRAEDDAGLVSLDVKYLRVGAEQTVVLKSLLSRDSETLPTQASGEFEWDLAPLALHAGDRIEFWAEARDACDVGEPHIGKSLTRSVIVVTETEKLGEIAERQTLLLEELARAHDVQQGAFDRVGELLVQLKNTGKLRDEDVQQFRQVESSQRQNWDRLFEGDSAVHGQVRELLAELRSNHIEHAPTSDRLDALEDELSTLQEETLPKLEQGFASVRQQLLGEVSPSRSNPATNNSAADDDKARDTSPANQPPATNDNPPNSKTPNANLTKPDDGKHEVSPMPRESWPSKNAARHAASLNTLRDQQRAALDSLDTMVALLSKWQRQHDLTGDLQSLIGNQDELHKETAAMRDQTIGRELRNLAPQQRADLEKLADRQRRQSDRLSDWESKLEDVLRKIDADSPLADSVNDALMEVRERAIAGRLQQASDDIQQNRIGQATETQAQLLKEFQAVEEILANRGVSDVETLVKKLKKAEEQLEQLHKRQDEILQKSVNAIGELLSAKRDEVLQRLTREQQELQTDTDRAARELRRLRANRASQALRRASQRMQSSEDELASGAADRATADQQESLDDLEQARRETANERRDAEERLAREVLDRMDEHLATMIVRQTALIDETKRIDAEPRSGGRWNRKQLKVLRDHAQAQKDLRDEVKQLSAAIATARVFSVALRVAAAWMTQANERISDRHVDAETVKLQETAKARLQDLVTALKAPDAPKETPDGTSGSTAGQQNSGGLDAAFLAQLKLLRSLQQDVKTATESAAKQTGNADDRAARLEELADQQGELANLLNELLETVARQMNAHRGLTGDTP